MGTKMAWTKKSILNMRASLVHLLVSLNKESRFSHFALIQTSGRINTEKSTERIKVHPNQSPNNIRFQYNDGGQLEIEITIRDYARGLVRGF